MTFKDMAWLLCTLHAELLSMLHFVVLLEIQYMV